MKIKSLLEATNPNKEYPIVVATYTPKGLFPELKDIVDEMINDEELPKDTKFTIDMLNDEAMTEFVKRMVFMYDEMGSDDRRADNYYKAQMGAIKIALKQQG